MPRRLPLASLAHVPHQKGQCPHNNHVLKLGCRMNNVPSSDVVCFLHTITERTAPSCALGHVAVILDAIVHMATSVMIVACMDDQTAHFCSSGRCDCIFGKRTVDWVMNAVTSLAHAAMSEDGTACTLQPHRLSHRYV